MACPDKNYFDQQVVIKKITSQFKAVINFPLLNRH